MRQPIELMDRDRTLGAARLRTASARGAHLALKILEPAGDGIPLGDGGDELGVARGLTLVARRELRLQVGLARVEIPELALEPGDAVLGRQVPDEQRIAEQGGQDETRGDEQPRKRRTRTLRHAGIVSELC